MCRSSDVKPANCLLSDDETVLKLAYVWLVSGRCVGADACAHGCAACVILSDFGSAAFLADGDDRLSSTVGTPAFLSPEVWVHHTAAHDITRGDSVAADEPQTPAAVSRAPADGASNKPGARVDACYLGGFAGKPADVWAAAVTFFMLVTGRHPFWEPGEQTSEQLQAAIVGSR